MNDDLMFDYLISMGQMTPQEAELKKKQAMVDALRKGAMTPQKGEMISGHYVGPGIAGAIGQLGQAYFASKGQQGIDAQTKTMTADQARILEELRRRRKGGGYMPPSTESLAPDNYDVGGGWNPSM